MITGVQTKQSILFYNPGDSTGLSLGWRLSEPQLGPCLESNPGLSP